MAANRRAPTTAFVFCGLAATMLGIVLWTIGDGVSITEFPEDFRRFIDALSAGAFLWSDVWLLGVVFVVTGVLSMA